MKAESLFVAHRDHVVRYLCHIVGRQEATDLSQEVFLRVARSAVPDAGTDGLRAWVFRIARNVALNYRRDVGRRPVATEPIDVARPAEQEVSAAIGEALATLSTLDRDVFLLREVVGLSYDEIAMSCEVSRAAVRSRLHRARQQLRDALQPYWTRRGAGA